MEGNFFFQATIYLLAAVIMVPIAKKLGLGSVLGYLIAGIVIGPFLLGFIGQEGQDIMHFAEFGVVMMLFLVGLELEPALLWRLRGPILGLGGLQVIITAIVVFLISTIIGLPWKEGLAIGFIVAMSSTAIVLQTLNEKGLMKTSAGQSSFAVLLFQDIAVIPILAFLPLLATKTAVGGADHHNTFISSFPSWAQPLIVIGAVALVIVAGMYIVKPVLRYVAKTRLRELFTATALLIVVSITVLMVGVGLSPALGTFLAGVILANSEYKHELESDIEPFKGLLLGLFFIAVGASIDFGMIAREPYMVFGIVAALMVIKTIILLVLGIVFKLKTDQNFIFAFGLSQVGEFAFVLLSFSLQEGVLAGETVSLLMAVVAITMALTPLVMLIIEKLILPRIGTKEIEVTKEHDTIEENNPIIIAGFGHFGSTIGRFLRANGVQATILDIDSDRVDTLRKMGLKVFYGDASRYDLLKSAGAEEAKLIILAIDDPEKNLEIIHTIKKHFPHLKILSRARNRYDAYELMDEGVNHIYRESLDTSIRLGVDALKMLGFRSHKLHRMAKTFFKLDEHHLKDLSKVRKDQKIYISYAKQRIEDMEESMKNDAMFGDIKEEGWDSASLVEEVRKYNTIKE
ncbi:MAG: monovalent cation:proton antiporter-2 (CPA2) family protein [Candidatus Kapabacteria bacterium]|nr:monovalent cation:proton antiporter-2 (CPA2) family protein [Candidatus Kapabacteria bacterium]